MNRLLEAEGSNREAIIAYNEKIATSQIFLRGCTSVPIIGILLLCGKIRINKSRDMIMAAGGWLKLKISNELHAVLYRNLQTEIDIFLSMKMKNPNANIDERQNLLIQIVKDLLS